MRMKTLVLFGTVTLSMALAAAQAALPGAEALADLIIDQFDSNGDTITAIDEWKAGMGSSFRVMDADGDGAVSGNELDDLGDPIGARVGDVGAKLIVPLVKRVVLSLDKDKNGVVSQAEFSGRTEAVFKRLDADENGSLARTELAQLPIRLFESPRSTPQSPEQKRDTALVPPKGLKTKLAPGYTIPVVDISGEKSRQVIVDREPGQYLGHPTTVLLEDNRTMLIVYPKGHGRGAIVYKRSADAGKTWGERLPTPKSWETSLEVPTLHRVVDASGKRRIIMFSGLFPIRMAFTEDDGAHWSELEPIGQFGGVVTMATVLPLKTPGHYLAFFHDDGRFIRGGDKTAFKIKWAEGEHASPAATSWRFWVYTTLSKDGGMTWSVPAPIAMLPDAHLCEPGAVRSPDGNQIAVLLRENSRKYNSFVIFSDDEGLTWSEPRELPAALTGDRHVAKYAPDGRLFISFRDTTHVSSTKGDWVGWVGSYDDIAHGRDGQYRVRIMDNTKGADCTYPGVEVLRDGTFVTTTYGHWIQGEQPYIVSVRFTLEELDKKAAATK